MVVVVITRTRRRLLASVIVIAAALCGSPARANAVEDAQSIIGQLSPINLGLGGLIDRAVAKGDDAMAARLRQLQGIIQEALSTADAIAQRRIGDVDSRAQNRLSQLKTAADDSMAQLDAVIKGTISIADAKAQERILQLQAQLGGLIEAINWLNVDPVVNVGTRGIDIYKQNAKTTAFLVSGIGLKKADVQPEAWIVIGKDEHLLAVKASTAAGVQFEVSNDLLQDAGLRHFTVKAHFSRGYHSSMLSAVLPNAINLRTPLEVTFPLSVMVLGPFTLDSVLSAAGETWEQKTIDDSNYGANPRIDCSKGDKPNAVGVEPVTDTGWEVDTEAAHGGLSWSRCDGREEHSCTFANAQLNLYCSAEHSPGGGWSAAYDVKSHLKRMKRVESCGEDKGHSVMTYGETVQVKMDKAKAVRGCSAPGLSATPDLVANVTIHRPYGAPDFVQIVRPGVMVTLPDDPVTLKLNADGTLNATLTPTFHWFYPPIVAGK